MYCVYMYSTHTDRLIILVNNSPTRHLSMVISCTQTVTSKNPSCRSPAAQPLARRVGDPGPLFQQSETKPFRTLRPACTAEFG